MKRCLLSLLFSAVILTGWAQTEKITERSAKKAPAWLGLSNADNFSVSGTAPTLDLAQQKCLEEIRQYIVTSIAANINSSEQLAQEQTSRDGLVSLLSHYSSQVDTKAAEMPFLCGITLSKSLDTYWERRFNKTDKSYYYISYVHYPFSEAERQEAIAEFRRIDNGYNARLETIRQNFDTFTDLSYIDQAVVALNPLISYFFDANRKRDAQGLQQQYLRACNEIAVVCDSAALGRYYFHLVFSGRRVTTDKQPLLKSDYATDMRVSKNGSSYVLLYTPMGIDTEENRIEMIYSFGGRALKHSLVFDPLAKTVSILPFGTLTVEQAAEELPSRISISLRAETSNRFEVRDVEVRIPGVGTARAELPGVSFEGKGTHVLRFETVVQPGDIEPSLAKGTLRLYNPATGMSSDLPFTLPCKVIINR